ncbi:MAG: hypothetical protein GY913_24200 [Proteobacteria bacterium]|nr:hypothetical protein [Pseudomonadota bacterium]MCP4920017.1 hypothetical protein [Pseudomonadota bacterium]
MKRIDLGPRADLYRHFRAFERPMFTICSRVDVRPLLEASDAGIFPTLLWNLLRAANAVPQLRQRIRMEPDEHVVEHEQVHCTCTVAQDDAFTFCSLPYNPDAAEFYAQVPGLVRKASESQGLDLGVEGRDDMLYLTCLPWLDFSSMQHAESGDPLDCVPRIAWGRVVDGHVTVCLTSHHSLVDGRHVAQFFEALAPAR